MRKTYDDKVSSKMYRSLPDIVEFPDSCGMIVVLDIETVSLVSKVDSSRVAIKDELVLTVTSTSENLK